MISDLTLSPTTVHGGWDSSGTVTLSGAAPAGGAAVALTSSARGVSTPSSVTVPEGASSATFRITTKAVKRKQVVTITASYNGSSASAQLTITR